jgi:hypothetical protein
MADTIHYASMQFNLSTMFTFSGIFSLSLSLSIYIYIYQLTCFWNKEHKHGGRIATLRYI